MAKTKEEKQAVVAKEEKKVDEQSKVGGPTYDELLDLVKSLSLKVDSLEKGKKPESSDDNMTNILSMLANRKSDREVAIVHNCELTGNLTTHIKLSNITIDFTHVGEQRLLSWSQFEECASKYKGFFDKKIILVSSDYQDIAEQYGLPCASTEKTHVLTHSDIVKLPKLTVPQLETFVNSLSKDDKDTVFSYWLGKCYSREEGFYDRHKMDTLNRLSNGAFETIILVKNGDDREIEDKN